jgi:hypothetical protein
LRIFVSTLLSDATPVTRRRVLGVHLLGDTPLEPLPNFEDFAPFNPIALTRPTNVMRLSGVPPILPMS